MRAVIQRVNKASVSIDGKEKSSIGLGLLVLLGIENADDQKDIEWLSGKISRLRIFKDDDEMKNNSVVDVDGEIMIISQFTLHASTKKGNRPTYIKAAKADIATPLYESFIAQMEKDLGKKVATGEFGAMMDISLINSGPVTIIIDSKNKV